jgi:UDP-N-acetylmuramyl tripeptide synthase
VVDGHLRLHLMARGIDADLGAIADMPLSVSGRAGYNVSNLLGAALAGAALGIPVPAIRVVLSRFGRANRDNPGRLQRWQLGGVQVFVDYAHNQEGLQGLLKIATSAPYQRLAIALGQAGNREDAEIRELSQIAAAFRPDLVLLKQMISHLRGRQPGAVTDLLNDELKRLGIVVTAPPFEHEIDAVRHALAWAQASDVLVLPIHTHAGRDQVYDLLDVLVDQGWRPGTALPRVS